MHKIFENRFGLVLSLVLINLAPLTSAWAQKTGAASGTAQQVIVTNTAAQPIPMVGLITEADAPGRKPLQTAILNVSVSAANAGSGGYGYKAVATVPANQRLVIEHVSGGCGYVNGYFALESKNAGSVTGFEYLSGEISTKLVSMPVKYYANPGDEVGIFVSNVNLQAGYCGVTVTGYYITLP